MAYTLTSVKKKGTNPGMPRGKKNIILLFDFDKFTMTRDSNNVKVTALQAIDGESKPVGMFVDQKSLDCGDAPEGDDYSRGYLHHVNFTHPGTELEVAEFKANNINSNLGAIVVKCDSSETTAKVYGTPCAPLVIQNATEEDTAEAHRTVFELQSAMRTWPVGIIEKSLIPKTDDPEIDTYLGIGAAAPAASDQQEQQEG